MFYGLGTGDRNLKKDINKFVALSPCAVPGKPLWKTEEKVKMEEDDVTPMKDEEGNEIMETVPVYWTLENLKDGLIANISSIPSIYGPEFDIYADTFYANIGEVFPSMLQANFGDEDFSPLWSRSSPSVKPFGTKLWI